MKGMAMAATSTRKRKTTRRTRKKTLAEKWTPEAEAELEKLVKEGRSYPDVNKMLIDKGLRKVFNPKALAIRASKKGWAQGNSMTKETLTKTAEIIPASEGEERVLVTLISTRGPVSAEIFNLSPHDADVVMNLLKVLHKKNGGANPG